MKGLKKLVLASAIIAASSSAFAMQAMDDESMSAATGQDGITIKLGTDISIGQLRIQDKDGLNASNVVAVPAYAGYLVGTPSATTGGSIVITGDGLGGNALRIYNTNPADLTTLVIDTGASGTAGLLHIAANLAATTVELDGTRIGVAAGNGSNLTGATYFLSFDAGTTLSLSATTLNIDLGNQPTGDLIWGTTTLAANGNGNILELTSLNINDTANAGSIGLSGIALSRFGGGSYTSTIGIGVNDDTVPATEGLYISVSSTDGLNVALADITLGDAASTASIGSVYIDNLTMANNTIYVVGH